MTVEPVDFRPKAYPPPDFPPRPVPAFARTPPAIYPVLLGFLGLALALREGFAVQGWPQALPDLVAGVALALWLFGVVAYGVKLSRRPAVLLEDLKVMTARAALASATVGGMAAAAVLAPFVPGLALALLLLSLGLHAVLVLFVLRVLMLAPAPARVFNPGWHVIFVGFIVGAMAAALLGYAVLARTILWLTLPMACVIWAASLRQLARGLPPEPLRPMLAIHLAPASLFATVAVALGEASLAPMAGGLAVAIFAALLLNAQMVIVAGFSPLWGAFTFPLAAFAGALIRLGGAWGPAGMVVLALAAVTVPLIGWRVLRMWPGGRLAERTNAAQA
jgi:tellurite resistance protein